MVPAENESRFITRVDNGVTVLALTGAASFLALLAMAGWLLGARELASIREDYFPMPPSTSAFILLTAAILLVTVWWPRGRIVRLTCRLSSLLLIGFAGTVLVEIFLNVEPGIEENLFGLRGELNGIPLGRMSPLAAAMFIILNISLLAYRANQSGSRQGRQAAALLALVALLTGGVNTLGYLYGSPLLYGGSTRPIALTAGVAISLLAAAIVAGAGKDLWPLKHFVGSSVRAQMMRSTLPLIGTLILVDGWIEAVVPDWLGVNPVLVSSLSALFFLLIAFLFVGRAAKTVGGSVDQANAERDAADERLQEVVAELRRSNEELEQFAYVASHDMQEPLRMVSSYMQLIERRYADRLDDDAREFIGFAVDGANRMQSMIRDLLALSRIGTRGQPFVSLESSKVVADALQDLDVAIKETGAEIIVSPLPRVTADPVQLRQLFQNLIANAIRFRGERPLRIEISAVMEDGEWTFSVKDNGIGFDEEYSGKIFAMFQRLHSRDKYEGTGMGLALCKKIVERHGGRIWAKSSPGQGSVFYFTIPIREETDGNKSD